MRNGPRLTDRQWDHLRAELDAILARGDGRPVQVLVRVQEGLVLVHPIGPPEAVRLKSSRRS